MLIVMVYITNRSLPPDEIHRNKYREIYEYQASFANHIVGLDVSVEGPDIDHPEKR